MSHVSRYECTIKNAQKPILDEACRQLATAKNWNVNVIGDRISVEIPGTRSTIAISIRNGNIVISLDEMYVGMSGHDVQALVEQFYTSTALQVVMGQMGYNVNTIDMVGTNVLVEGIRY